ncbi:hypothetical protein RI129_009006 [Pyrocoelia pectoralis]|uniref:SOWAHA-C winged helix-turn-helix domain-containing protein n=1 Tax=Pyrocoelia pectoralis TaxID=417401 RepID=A0AAN7VF71_9COLE
MAANELSIDVILDYFIEKGGIVSNRDVVKHFKRYLTDPSTREEARITFKKYINTLATTKTEGDEKFLILKPKYSPCPDGSSNPVTSPKPCLDPINSIGIPVSPSHSNQDASPRRQPPPYRPPPPPPPATPSPNISYDNISISSSISLAESVAPQAPPRRRNSEKLKQEESPRDDGENQAAESDKQPVSVKERTQKFNRMASVEDELSPRNQKGKKIPDKGADEDDGASVTSLDPKKCTEWLVTAAKGDYQELAKLASDEPRLVKLKTVLHWGAKHGNEDIIKLFAGKYKADVNSKTGYTPLHMAVQFGHRKVFNLLVEVYRADPNIRDFSGRKPTQYEIPETQNSNKDTYKIKSRKKLADKDLRFLRIGSLNVRVKRTTEAFSHFLGVGGGSSINPTDLSDKVFKSWGSADNLSQDNVMPAPKNYPGKRKMKKSESTGVSSTPGTPSQIQRTLRSRTSLQDSDSDTAAGFDSQWKN